jgi:hypothetical protein
MAPRPTQNKRRTAAFYARNPESRRKKAAYDKKYNARPSQRKYRSELSAERAARGMMGKGGKDLSHAAGGGFITENPATNRARNGHGNNRRLAPGSGTTKRKRRR